MLAGIVLFLSLPALASGRGPNGINIGLDFNWDSINGPHGYTASFIQSVTSSGTTLNNCSGTLTSTTTSCNLAFSYDIGGVAQTAVLPGGVYNTWNPSVGSSFCDRNPNNSAPLTMFNCFNSNSFGQIFMASATGTLSNVRMPMTCLNPAGGAITGVVALLYQVNADGGSLPATPLAQVPVDLSSCPT
jgi:hypothetical protein